MVSSDISHLTFFSSSIYCAPSVAREQTAYEERIPSKAHSPSGKVLWVYGQGDYEIFKLGREMSKYNLAFSFVLFTFNWTFIFLL